jgi:hypothetical protein
MLENFATEWKKTSTMASIIGCQTGTMKGVINIIQEYLEDEELNENQRFKLSFILSLLSDVVEETNRRFDDIYKGSDAE